MTEMMEIYSVERERLEHELVLVKDLKAAVDCVCRSLERMRLEYCSKAENKQVRAEADRLFEIARLSVKCMLSATGAGVKLLRDEQVAVTPKDKLIALLPASAMVVGAVLTVWLMLKDMNVPAVLAAVLTGIAWMETQVVYRRRVAVAAFGRVDSNELMRLVDRLMESMDYSLEMCVQEKAALPGGEKAASTQENVTAQGMLGPVQMLLEAAQTQDGEYALKAVPSLAAALREQGIETVYYSRENEQYFDMFPGTEAGITIRPALMKEGKLLARGQATEALE